jgi:conjugative relaxase-like TrwC/TraI family protein
MLRVTQSVSAKGATHYFDQSLARADYYTAEQSRSMGVWGGVGAEHLGLIQRIRREDSLQLIAEVRREDFKKLVSNIHPLTGENLTVRTLRGNKRTAGYDFTWSVPKSVSLFAALNPETPVSQLITDAVKETMAELELEMKTRVRGRDAAGRPRDEERVTGNMVYAAFVHELGRPVDGVPDPHFHVHCYVLNATYDAEEKRWKAGYFRDLKRDAPYWEAAFHGRVASKLMAAGYAIRRTEKDFELAAVSRETIEKFSRRTMEIEKFAQENEELLRRRANHFVAKLGVEYGEGYALAKAELGAKTRAAKDKGELDHGAQLAHWESVLTPEEKRSLSPEAVKAKQSEELLAPELAQELAIDHSFERRSVVTQRSLEAAVLRLGIGRVSAEDAKRFMSRDSRLVWTDNREVTTHRVLEEEREVIRLVKAGQGQAEAWAPGGSGWECQDQRLSEEQRAAIRHLLESPDNWVGIRGAAGTGKTTMMQEAVSAISALSGQEVAVFAPSSAAAKVLCDDGFAAETFQMLQHSLELQGETAGKIIWVDEAGFLSSRQMHWLADYAARTGGRVILTGDPHQHHAVERGDMLRVLMKADALKVVELTEIQRQKDPELRSAVYALSTGEIGHGFEMLDQQGRIIEIEDDPERNYALVQKHLQAVAAGQSSLVVSPTHAEARSVADGIREALREQGAIGSDEVTVKRLVNTGWTYGERRDAAHYERGQVVEFHRAVWGVTEEGRQIRFDRAECWHVVEAGGDRLLVEKGSGRGWLSVARASDFGVYTVGELKLSEGDTVRVTKNHLSSDGQKLLNNLRFTVASFTDNKIELSNGAKLDVSQPLHLDQGYAVTSHSAQGQTVAQVLVACPVRSMDLLSAVMFYVGVSRARTEVQVFTDSRAALLETVEENHGVRTAAVEAMGEVEANADELRRRQIQAERREERQRQGEELARKREEARQAERSADKVILERLFHSGRLGSGKDPKEVASRARQLLSELSEVERREFGPTLERLVLGSELRRRDAGEPRLESLRQRYEREFGVQFRERYPNPTPEQQVKIATRIKGLVERALADVEKRPEFGGAKTVVVDGYKRELLQRAAQKFGADLTPALEQLLQKRIEVAGRKYWDRLFKMEERPGAGEPVVVSRDR